MTVDVAPGTYDLLAWCGSTDKGSFRIPESDSGKELTLHAETRKGFRRIGTHAR